MAEIFIGYRRDDGGHARALYEKLRDWFDAEQLFLDHENLEPGAKFRPELEQAVRDCKTFLTVIGPHWLSEKNRQRLQDPQDVTRGEIRSAIEQHKNLIPILAGGAAFPDTNSLPADIAAFSEDNAHHQLEAQYRASFQKLLDTLQHSYGLQPEYRRQDGNRQTFRTNRELPSPHFADPTAKLPALHEVLAQGGRAALTAATVQGMGGVGKTQLALKYSHAFRDEYEGVWWFRAEDSVLLEQDCEELCRERNIARRGNEPHSASLARWLTRQTRWLLVYDNADDPKRVQPHLPQAGGHHVLFTSRNPNWRGIVTPAQQLDLETWSGEQALEFLNSRLPEIPDRDGRRLAQALGGLPLALEMAAAYLEQNGCDVEAYLAALADVEEIRLLDGETPATGYPHGVLAALSLAFGKLSPVARELLSLCGWLAPEPVSERLFIEQGELFTPSLQQATAKPSRWRETVGELRRYALCQTLNIAALDAPPEEGRKEKALQFHRLTQQAVRARPAMEGAGLSAAMALLYAAFPKEINNPRNWPRQAALLPHVQGLERFSVLGGFDIGHYTWLLDRAASYLQYGPALYLEARRMFEKALEIRRLVLGEEQPATLVSHNNLAEILRAQGDLSGARGLQERALEIRRRVLGDENPDTLTAMNNLAGTLWAQGDLPGARGLEEKALEIRSRLLGDEHPDTLTSMNNLAETLRSQGELSGARVLHEKALEIRSRVLGEDHPDTLTSMNNLASTLLVQGLLPGAQALHEKALEISCRVLGDVHPGTSISAFNLIGTLLASGERVWADVVCRENLAWLLEKDPMSLGADQRNIQAQLREWRDENPTPDANPTQEKNP